MRILAQLKIHWCMPYQFSHPHPKCFCQRRNVTRSRCNFNLPTRDRTQINGLGKSGNDFCNFNPSTLQAWSKHALHDHQESVSAQEEACTAQQTTKSCKQWNICHLSTCSCVCVCVCVIWSCVIFLIDSVYYFCFADDYYDTEDPSVNLHEFIVNSMQVCVIFRHACLWWVELVWWNDCWI